MSKIKKAEKKAKKKLVKKFQKSERELKALRKAGHALHPTFASLPDIPVGEDEDGAVT